MGVVTASIARLRAIAHAKRAQVIRDTIESLEHEVRQQVLPFPATVEDTLAQMAALHGRLTVLILKLKASLEEEGGR